MIFNKYKKPLEYSGKYNDDEEQTIALTEMFNEMKNFSSLTDRLRNFKNESPSLLFDTVSGATERLEPDVLNF